jgi:Fibrinogen beta and gamma chains, C-terminal globular domain
MHLNFHEIENVKSLQCEISAMWSLFQVVACSLHLNVLIGDSMSGHVGHGFTTFDEDHDTLSSDCCAVIYRGAWWYDHCHWSNLNGLYLHGSHTSYADGVEWYTWTGYYYSLNFTEMKIRPQYLWQQFLLVIMDRQYSREQQNGNDLSNKRLY